MSLDRRSFRIGVVAGTFLIIGIVSGVFLSAGRGWMSDAVSAPVAVPAAPVAAGAPPTGAAAGASDTIPGAASGAPQPPQNFSPASLAYAHAGQATGSPAPQCAQKRRPARFAVLQREHCRVVIANAPWLVQVRLAQSGRSA